MEARLERKRETLFYSIVYLTFFLLGMVYFSAALSFTSLLHSCVFLVISLLWFFIWLRKNERFVDVVSLFTFAAIATTAAFLTGYRDVSNPNHLARLAIFVAAGYSLFRVYNMAASRKIRFVVFLLGMSAVYFFMHEAGKMFRGIF